MKVLAVYFANLKAFSGRGTVAALVQGESGECRLYGVTMLAKAGLLDKSQYGRYIQADDLAKLLGSPPVIRGAEACRTHLAESEIAGVTADDILSDAIERRKAKRADADLRKF